MNCYANKATEAYRSNSVEIQSQGKLIVMLYDGAIRFVENAQDAIVQRNIQDAHDNIIKAENIVIELKNTLKKDGSELSEQLLSLYEYLYSEMIRANLEKDIEILENVKKVLIELGSSWKQIA